MISLLFILFEFHYCNTGISLAEFPCAESGHVGYLFQMGGYGRPQCSGPLAVNYTDARQMGQIGIVEILIKLGNGFIDLQAYKVYLR